VVAPPPHPTILTPVAPSAAETDIGMPATPEPLVPEDTSSLQAPDAGELVGHLLALVAGEAEALLAGEGTDARLAELNVRSALASWDALHQTDEALRLLELAEGHPLRGCGWRRRSRPATRRSWRRWSRRWGARRRSSSSWPRRGCGATAGPTGRPPCWSG